jgi:hypothetical protein
LNAPPRRELRAIIQPTASRSWRTSGDPADDHAARADAGDRRAARRTPLTRRPGTRRFVGEDPGSCGAAHSPIASPPAGYRPVGLAGDTNTNGPLGAARGDPRTPEPVVDRRGSLDHPPKIACPGYDTCRARAGAPSPAQQWRRRTPLPRWR